MSIAIADLTEADKGRRVIYHAHDGHTEDGILSSWNDKYIFVRYGQGDISAATDPDQLTFAT